MHKDIIWQLKYTYLCWEIIRIMKAYKIVGAGLAGINLAWHFYFEKIKFVIVDNKERSTARAAAGLINPVVFRRLNKSWMADDLMPYLHSFYCKINDVLGKELYVNLPIKKVITDIENLNDWGARNNDEAYQQFYNEVEENYNSSVLAEYGLGVVNGSGYLKLEEYINLSLEFFKAESNTVVEEEFEYDKVEGEIIFTEGRGLLRNPYFKYLPLNQTHGETLLIKAENLNIDYVLNKNMFVLPVEKNIYRVGATYNWEIKEPRTTEGAKAELLEKLSQIVDCELEVLDQWAGLRPTVKDRRPLLGTHKEHKNLHVFNGLGTKGVMISPYFANIFLQYLQGKRSLPQDVSIRRFDHLMNE
ncbi:MAG: FAD-binding oxidoreductase [Crocinitomicaceae bacterium]|nr:FAD-binding oxidoreductase [Crocinitomicaceae bacterium]